MHGQKAAVPSSCFLSSPQSRQQLPISPFAAAANLTVASSIVQGRVVQATASMHGQTAAGPHSPAAGMHSMSVGLHSPTTSMRSKHGSMHSPFAGKPTHKAGLHSAPACTHSPFAGLHSAPDSLHSGSVGLHSPSVSMQCRAPHSPSASMQSMAVRPDGTTVAAEGIAATQSLATYFKQSGVSTPRSSVQGQGLWAAAQGSPVAKLSDAHALPRSPGVTVHDTALWEAAAASPTASIERVASLTAMEVQLTAASPAAAAAAGPVFSPIPAPGRTTVSTPPLLSQPQHAAHLRRLSTEEGSMSLPVVISTSDRAVTTG